MQKLHHTYPSSRRGQGERVALSGITFNVGCGEIFGLLGPNGSGKTTLFRILSTLLTPVSGIVRVFGVDLDKDPYGVRYRLGVVFQSPSLDNKLTVVENLRHQGHLYGLWGRVLHLRIAEMLEWNGLSDRAHDRVEHLSGGLRRRVELAKALLHGPELLLLDEPSTGLDPGARQDFWNYLKELRTQQKVTILFTTHLIDEAESCDRVGILHRGQLVALGVPEVLKQTIGGDVISLETKEPNVLCGLLKERFGGDPVAINGVVRIERQHGHQFIPQLIEAFPGKIESVRVGKPTLEDVFIRQTGHHFWQEKSEGSIGENHVSS
ncbi:MAG: ABC transporter ATP-binding protein [Candidatus Latescibacteria bacterium]|nr:ABC transporter ATP-binding protein [Candidatus Latescibacterota bacterium]